MFRGLTLPGLRLGCSTQPKAHALFHAAAHSGPVVRHVSAGDAGAEAGHFLPHFSGAGRAGAELHAGAAADGHRARPHFSDFPAAAALRGGLDDCLEQLLALAAAHCAATRAARPGPLPAARPAPWLPFPAPRLAGAAGGSGPRRRAGKLRRTAAPAGSGR